MQCGLAAFLFYLHQEMLLHPLEKVGLPMPSGWGEVLGWCLAVLPLTPLLGAAGAVIVRQVVSSQELKVGGILMSLKPFSHLKQKNLSDSSSYIWLIPLTSEPGL